MASRKQRLDLIIRVSQRDGREGDNFRSPDQQREIGERFAAQNNAKIVKVHEAIGRSGKTMERADVDAVVERIQRGRTDGVVVAWINRFSRAPTDEALAICRLIDEAGGKFYPADLPNVDIGTPIGEFTLTMMFATARLQWAQTAERYDISRRDAIRDGKAVGGAPFGYRFADPTPNGDGRAGVRDSHLVVDEKLGPIVAEVFERRADGATALELARWLDEVAPKPDGRLWARQTVTGLIKRRTYLGEVSHGKHVNAKAHEPIVDAALWRRAQRKPGRRTPRGTYLLSGLPRCAGCGKTLRGTTQGKKPHKGRKALPPRIYNCQTRGCEAPPTIVVDRLDAEVTEQFFARLGDFHVHATTNGEVNEVREDVKRLTGEIERLAAIVPTHPAAVAAHQEALAEKERELAAEEDRLHDLTASLDEDGPDVRELREDWPDLTLDERREILRAGIDAVLVRRAPSPTSKPPTADRIVVLFRGEAPDGLITANGHGPVTRWAWDDDPSSLRAAA